MRRMKLLGGLLALMLVSPAHADDDLEVVPYRPSVSTPAQLPKPGQLELEVGALATKTGSERRNSLPYQFKLAFNAQWGMLLGGEAYAGLHDGELRQRGLGDTSITLKRAFIVDAGTAFGLELEATAPTAKVPTGSGKSDWTLNAIFSRDIGKVHLDANLNQTRLGAPDPGTARLQSGAALALSNQFAAQWTVIGELSGTRNRGADSTAQLLAALSYAPNKRLVIDVGVVRGLNAASPDWSLFTGFVVPLARLW